MSSPLVRPRRPVIAALAILLAGSLACNLLPGIQATATPIPLTATSPPAAPTVAPEATATPGLLLTKVAKGSGAFPLAIRLVVDSQDVLHLVWRSTRDRQPGDFYHQQLAPGGEWTDPETLTSTFEYLDVGPMLLNNAAGQACVLWTGGPSLGDSSTWGLYQTCQAPEGWSQPALAIQDIGAVTPVVAPDGTIISLSFGRLAGVQYNGALISSETTAAVLPNLAIDSAGTLHAAWVALGAPYAVVHRSSTDGGQHWSAEETASDAGTAPSGLEFVMAGDSPGNVHLAWTNGGAIVYRRWSPAGWGELETPGPGFTIGLAADSAGRARLVWASGNGIVYSAPGSDGKHSSPLPFGNISGRLPALAVDSTGTAHVVWTEDPDFYYVSFGAPE